MSESIKKMVGIIPARYASSRFPGKPLALIAGKPLLQWVVERVQMANSLSEVIVATDDQRIFKVAEKFCRVEMTSPSHPNGTVRIAEVASQLKCDGVVNVQGDEPLIDPEIVNQVANALDQFEMSTAATPLETPDEYEDSNTVKVVVNQADEALYFSRRTIPFLRDSTRLSAAEQMNKFPFLKHLGIYGYRRETLLRLVELPESALEKAEKLEQLRALDHGIKIGVVRVKYNCVGVDTPEDVRKVERLLSRE